MSVWELVYDTYDPAAEPLREALCTVGNGAFATRGAAPESRADGAVHYPGTYVAGLYDRLKTRVGDRDVENEDLVNCPNWLVLDLSFDGMAFDLDALEVVEFRQVLDLRRGVLTRDVTVGHGKDRRTRVVQERFVSTGDPRTAALSTTVTPLNWSGRLVATALLDGSVHNSGVARYRLLRGDHLRLVDAGHVDDATAWVEVRTTSSGVRVAEAQRCRVLVDGRPSDVSARRVHAAAVVGTAFTLDVGEGRPVTVEKVVALATSRDRAIYEPAAEVRAHLERSPDFAALRHAHERELSTLWDRFGIEVDDGNSHTQLVLNLHVFSLLVTVAPWSVGLDVGVPARGLHGEAYRGHIFWDELFIFPTITFRAPEVTRALLQYRYRRLPAARAAAAADGHVGAMFPWQSGSDGREETQVVHLNPNSGRWLPDGSHLQRHIGLAIAWNVWHYVETTGDDDFLTGYGAELLIDIARFFASKAEWSPEHERYRIRGVMGPDEYHESYPDRTEPGLDDNAYTNVMTAWLLRRALDVLDRLPAQRRRELEFRLGLEPQEVTRLDEVSRRLRVPFLDTDDGTVIEQFEGYSTLLPFDWDGYRERYGNIARLDRILEAEDDTTDRYQVSKQADVLMLFYLLTTEELEALWRQLGYDWDPELVPRTVRHALARTSHGSTLSRVVGAWVLARGDREGSWRFFTEALESDIGDIQGGTTAEGIHLGAMAGTVDLVQRGYTGLRMADGVLMLDPALPEELRTLRCTLRVRRVWGVVVEVRSDAVRLRVPSDAPESVRVQVCGGEVVSLTAGEDRSFPLPT